MNNVFDVECPECGAKAKVKCKTKASQFPAHSARSTLFIQTMDITECESGTPANSMVVHRPSSAMGHARRPSSSTY